MAKKSKKVQKHFVTYKDIHEYTSDSVFRVIFETQPDSAESVGTDPDDYWSMNGADRELVMSCLCYTVAASATAEISDEPRAFWGDEDGDCGRVSVKFGVYGCMCALHFIKDSDTVGVKAELTAHYTFDDGDTAVVECSEYEVRSIKDVKVVLAKACREAKSKALRSAAEELEK